MSFLNSGYYHICIREKFIAIIDQKIWLSLSSKRSLWQLSTFDETQIKTFALCVLVLANFFAKVSIVELFKPIAAKIKMAEEIPKKNPLAQELIVAREKMRERTMIEAYKPYYKVWGLIWLILNAIYHLKSILFAESKQSMDLSWRIWCVAWLPYIQHSHRNKIAWIVPRLNRQRSTRDG